MDRPAGAFAPFIWALSVKSPKEYPNRLRCRISKEEVKCAHAERL
jgi:hypothetical protein